ncbi:Chromo domain/shadow [Lasallia pustulata]|uniref:Chromo domain/shadow n=1 Tax=Lasallia pustulata TaxID=136370 RepID=A0A1W5D3A9_9LECA|nr:Chromo domain/shadow [Lasallia pustulata]
MSDCYEWLPLAEFAVNNHVNASTGMSPFFADTAQHPRMSFDPPCTIPNKSSITLKQSNQAGNEFAQKMHDIIGVLQENLTAAQARYEAQANRKRDAALAYRVGDKVFLSMKNIATDRPSKKFDQRYLREYTITKVVNSHAYQLDLPPEYKSLHDVFHPNLLLPCPTDPFPGQTNEKQRSIGIDIDGQKLWAVDTFHDTCRHNGHFQYQVLWRGYDESEKTWEPLQNVMLAHGAVREFERQFPNKKKPTKKDKERALKILKKNQQQEG